MVEPHPKGEDEEERRERRRWLRSVGTVVMLVAASVTIFVVITARTGLSGPGPLRRYREVDLEALAAKIDTQPTAEVPNCHGVRIVDPQAHVDLLRSRVVVEGRAITELLSGEEQAMLSEHAFMPAAPVCP